MGYSNLSGRSTGRGLWSRDQETYWALGSIAHHRKGWWPVPGQRFRRGSRVICVAKPKLPYGRATAKPITDRTVSHITNRVLLAWRGGRLIGTMVIWLCGSTSTEYHFEEEIHSRPCTTCFLREGSLGMVLIQNSLVIIGGDHG